MSENITHVAIVDDAIRLAMADTSLSTQLRGLLQSHNEIVRLGSITRFGDRFTPELLTQTRDKWHDGTLTDEDENILAFVLGWLCHRAADRQMKPVFRELAETPRQSPTECSVYHDAFMFRRRYLGKADNPYGDFSFLTQDKRSPLHSEHAALREFFQHIMQVSLINLHTLNPDQTDIGGWINGVAKLRQTWRVDLDRYIAAIVKPDARKTKKYIEDGNFYLASEPVIALAESLHRGEGPTGADLEQGISTPPTSHYAQALYMAWQYLRDADAYLAGDMTREGLDEALRIGVLGRDGVGV